MVILVLQTELFVLNEIGDLGQEANNDEYGVGGWGGTRAIPVHSHCIDHQP